MLGKVESNGMDRITGSARRAIQKVTSGFIQHNEVWREMHIAPATIIVKDVLWLIFL